MQQYETLAQEMADDIGQDDSDGWDEAWYQRNYAGKTAEEVILPPVCGMVPPCAFHAAKDQLGRPPTMDELNEWDDPGLLA